MPVAGTMDDHGLQEPIQGLMSADVSLAKELNTFFARFKAASSSTNANSASANNAKGAISAANSASAEPIRGRRPLIMESDKRRVFKSVNTRKVVGPDSICGRVLKACTHQLAPVFTDIFNLSLTHSIIPSCFKRSTIDPVPRKPWLSCLNDYCPVALTSVVMCFEKMVRDLITSSLPASSDPLQFAYCHNGSTDDAIVHLLHTTLTHLDKDTGAPQGCVLSPLLYSLYTYDCVATSSSTTIKFADDIIVLGLISDNSERAYLKKQEQYYQPVGINGTMVKRVNSFRYLSVHIFQDLSLSHHTNSLAKKTHQHLYHFRCLRDFRLPSKMLQNLYTCIIESILMGSITVWLWDLHQAGQTSSPEGVNLKSTRILHFML
ncbi:hypothetical protein P4O66_019701 [Electrophorus voltai]|uniref:Alkylated DNA repair protein AlkB homologue 8 N-terminal domain-containing protein n=1 Tax=Electrophorus voltai TaxID=2609070 RepID=A0AAD8ZXY6_9TELE|nr:hypothetical protein P4O66_019701 [Electrophorus voltai]